MLQALLCSSAYRIGAWNFFDYAVSWGVEVDTDHSRDCLGVLELLSVNWELLVARPLLRGSSLSGSPFGSAASSRLLGVEVDSDHTRRYLGVLVLPLGLKGASYSSATKRLDGMTGTLASVLLLLVRCYHTKREQIESAYGANAAIQTYLLVRGN